MEAKPKVSALTVCYNRQEMLRECIQSVLSQTYPVHEMIVIDDGSTEDLLSVVRSFNDPCIKYFRYPRIGRLSNLRNLAMSKASGDYVAFIDSDDLWHEDKVRRHVEVSEETNAVITFSDCQYFDESGHRGPPVCEGLNSASDVLHEMFFRRQSIAYGTNIFFRNRPVDVPAIFNPRMQSGEHDFVSRMVATHKSVFIPAVLNYIRLHPGNSTAPGSIFDVVSLVEYYRTLGWLRDREKIGGRIYRRERATVLVKAGAALLEREKRRIARRLIFSGTCMWISPLHLRVLAKAFLPGKRRTR